MDAGHFALDLKSKEIIQLVGDFMNNVLRLSNGRSDCVLLKISPFRDMH
jgi:hypothetical protein